MADQIRPTPRSPILGLFSDLVNLPLEYMSAPQRTQQMQGVAEFIRGTGVPSTLERLSYGQGLFTGAGGLGGTTRLRPEVAEAALTVAPMVGPAARLAGRGAMAVGRAGERYAERVVPQIMERGGLPAEMVSAMGQGTQSPLTVYHGSPYRFNRFDPTKIGSGEGAQSYGYGHYVAEAPGVAAEYRKQLAPGVIRTVDDVAFDSSNPQHMAASYIEMFGKRGKSPEQIAQMLSEGGHNEAAQIVLRGDKLGQIGEQARGAFYKIDLPDPAIAKMLDWDKPLSQQPDIVKSINPQSLGLTYKQLENGNHAFVNSEGKIIGNLQKGGTQESFTKNWTEDVLRGTGSDLYRQLGQGMEGGPKVSSALREAGIPGIRYLDQGSRSNFRVQNTYKGQPYGEPVSFMTEQQAKDYAAEQIAKGFGADLKPGTSNFVVFPGNEDLLRILEVNGEELLNPIMYRDPFGSTVR